MPAALQGIRVLDLSRILAGPWCTQILGDLGAQIIKIENPDGGDDTRAWGPPWVTPAAGGKQGKPGDAAYFYSTNRNKSSVAVNLKTAQGAELVRQLAGKCDVFVENFKVGGLHKLGLDYQAIKAINPAIIYLSITGFGQTGPMANQPGYDYLIQGLGGLMSITGEADDRPGGGPQRVGVAVADVTTGLYGAIGVLAALQHRNATGQGQHIDLALLDSQVSWLINQATNYLIGGEIPSRIGTSHPNLVPYQPFQAADGHIIIAVGNDRQFRELSLVLGHSWHEDSRFAKNGSRVEHRELLVPLIAEKIAQQASEFWLRELPAAGVPCARINRIDQVFEEPQVQARNMQIQLPHPRLGDIPGVGNPLKFSESPVAYRSAPEDLGQATEQVLSDILGLSMEEISQLAASGAIAAGVACKQSR